MFMLRAINKYRLWRSKKNDFMQIKVFTLPLQPNDEQTEELNHFLRANKVVDIKKELANMGGKQRLDFLYCLP